MQDIKMLPSRFWRGKLEDRKRWMTKNKRCFFTGMAGMMMAVMLIGLSMRSNTIVSRGLSYSLGQDDYGPQGDNSQTEMNVDISRSELSAASTVQRQEVTISTRETTSVHTRKKTVTAPSKVQYVSANKPSSGGYVYPDWFAWSWPRSAIAGLENIFVGDQPLFPPCSGGGGETYKGYPFVEPKNFLPETKDPCWYDNPKDKRGLRCAPYFYLAGVAKGGTTDLYRRIRMHPDVMIGTMKEYHWWERFRYRHLSKDEITGDINLRGGTTFKEYIDRVTGPEIKEVIEDLNDKGTCVKIFGDGSPSYIWDSYYWLALDGNQGCMEPRMVIGQHIRHFYPDAKIILTFRHPTPRLYSRFLSRIPRVPALRKSTAKDFHTYVVNGIAAYKACFQRWSIRHCTFNHSLYIESVVRIVEGFYPVFMADWLRIWPKEQMLMLRYEDYAKNLKSVLLKSFDFLDLAKMNEEQMANATAVEPLNVGNLYDKVGKMLPETKAALDEFYEPFVHKFHELMKDERFLWSDVEH